jgi:hypothetical protein
MPKKKKHVKDMTTDELAKHVFHPKALAHLRQAIAESDKKSVEKKLTKG